MDMKLDFNMWLKIFGFLFIFIGLCLFEMYDFDVKKILAMFFFGVGTILFMTNTVNDKSE